MTVINIKIAISVIIPTLNGEKTLTQLFAALKIQNLQPDEILVGDSSSDDRTVDICHAAGAKVVPIAKTDFDHGGTRTALARQAKGAILVFLTQDAILATRDALEHLVAPLQGDGDIACSYGRQLPKENATVIASHLRGFNYPLQSSARGYGDRKKYGLKTVFISNSFAAYKKECLAEVDYFKNGLIFGEDTCTLGRLLNAEYRVAYIGQATVYHSHNYSILEEFRRSFDIGVLHSSEKWLLDIYGRAEDIGGEYIRSVFAMLLRQKEYILMVDCLLRSICKYIGYKLGRSYKILPSFLRPILSMNRLWWEKKASSTR